MLLPVVIVAVAFSMHLSTSSMMRRAIVVVFAGTDRNGASISNTPILITVLITAPRLNHARFTFALANSVAAACC
jgi:hypothetical protein